MFQLFASAGKARPEEKRGGGSLPSFAGERVSVCGRLCCSCRGR
jgi:hypothetical protein